MENLEPDTTLPAPIWGLQRDITPRLGARLVQQATTCIFYLTVPVLSAHLLLMFLKH